jgi:hypothetical protein
MASEVLNLRFEVKRLTNWNSKMKSLKYLFAITVITGMLTLSASATFIIDPNPGGETMFISPGQTGVTDFLGFVGGNDPSMPNVGIHTTGPVITLNGVSNIKPVVLKPGALTSLTFTPANPNLFHDFSFIGQLIFDAQGTVTAIVQDNQGHAPQTLTFTGLGKNVDFARQGIVSLDGETIKSVTLESDWKDIKKINFSFAPRVPDSGATLTLLGGVLAGLGLLRRYLQR